MNQSYRDFRGVFALGVVAALTIVACNSGSSNAETSQAADNDNPAQQVLNPNNNSLPGIVSSIIDSNQVQQAINAFLNDASKCDPNQLISTVQGIASQAGSSSDPNAVEAAIQAAEAQFQSEVNAFVTCEKGAIGNGNTILGTTAGGILGGTGGSSGGIGFNPNTLGGFGGGFNPNNIPAIP